MFFKINTLRCLLAVVICVLAVVTYAQPMPPYSVNWIYPVNAAINGTILTKNQGGSSWNAGASSSNILDGNTDGWIEFTAQTGAQFQIGLTVNNIIDIEQMSYGLTVDHSNNYFLAYEGSTVSNLGTSQAGDVFRISREGNQIKYYRNGNVVRTITVSPGLSLRIKAILRTVGKSTPSITTSFDSRLLATGAVIGADGPSGSGSITLAVVGGTSPYTYMWSSGEQTSGISGKSIGVYSATITDAVGRTVTKNFEVGYKINWINKVGVTTSGDVLTKNVTYRVWNNAGAVSSNLLPPNTDGWVEFSIAHNADYMIGFAVNDIIDDNTQYSNCIQIQNRNNNSVSCEGATAVGFGSYNIGDIFRISREGNQVKYYHNGIVKRSVTVNPALVLKAKVSILENARSTPHVTTSFDSRLMIQGTVAGLDGTNGMGSISVNILGGTAPYTYSWSSGEQTASITNKGIGSYTLTVNDAAGRTADKTYGIGYKINWINKLGVVTNGDILTKNVTPRTMSNSGAMSSNILPGNTDGWIEFSIASLADFMIGFSVNDVIDDNNQYTNCIQIYNPMHSINGFEGETAGGLGSYQIGDVFRISRQGNQVHYYHNGVVKRSVSTNPALALKVKVSILAHSSSSPNVVTSFDAKLLLQSTVAGLDGASSTGGVSVNVIGGTTPYTYSWSSGEQTSSISGKPTGSYILTVSDAAGRTANRTFSIGYKINWINKMGVTTNGDILTKNVTIRAWTNSGAISANILPANTDGWIEFSSTSASDLIIGLAVNNIINSTEFISGIQVYNPNSTFYTFEGATQTGLGQWQLEDVFRISREGNQVKYYYNGTLRRTVAVNPALALRVKATILGHLKSTPNITTSFDSQLILQGTVSGLEGNSGSGGISVNVMGGTAPYTYSWSTGEQIASIAGKPMGAYTITVTDASGRTASRTYTIGYKVDWTNKIGVATSGDILTKNITTAGWTNAGAVSSNILPANTNGWMEFSVTSTSDFFIGLTVNNTINYSQFSNAIQLHDNSSSSVGYEGMVTGAIGQWQMGELFRISREGNQIRYYQNGIVKRTVTVNPSLALKVKVTINEYLKSTPSITSSFWKTDGIVRTYYSITDGNWTTPAVWSLSENGPPSTVYPDDVDKVVIKGHEVVISSEVKSAGIIITSTNDKTRLKVEGSMGVLTVRNNIIMNRQGNVGSGEVLLVQNNGKLNVVD